MRYVLIPKFCDASGYTEKAVRRKIEEGVWIENRQYRRAPDGHIMIDTEAALEAERPAPPPVCGVYLLFHREALAYVGRSTRLQARLAAHASSGREFDEVRIIPCDAPTSEWLEPELIRTLDPPQNRLRYERRAKLSRAALRALQ